MFQPLYQALEVQRQHIHLQGTQSVEGRSLVWDRLPYNVIHAIIELFGSQGCSEEGHLKILNCFHPEEGCHTQLPR